MSKDLFQLFSAKMKKEHLIEFIKQNPQRFEEIVIMSYAHEQPQGWRACWLVGHVMANNDRSIKGHIDQMIMNLPNCADGHQRELIKVIGKMSLGDEQEGRFFNVLLSIWGSIHKKSSVRITAFRQLSLFIEKYPELIDDLQLVMEEPYLETLTPGILKSFDLAYKRLLKSLSSSQK
jgi:hypothetical protein